MSIRVGETFAEVPVVEARVVVGEERSQVESCAVGSKHEGPIADIHIHLQRIAADWEEAM